MKKLFITLVSVLLLFTSATYAVETSNHKMQIVQKNTVTKQDTRILFGTSKVKSSLLNNMEMKKTEGQSWFSRNIGSWGLWYRPNFII